MSNPDAWARAMISRKAARLATAYPVESNTRARSGLGPPRRSASRYTADDRRIASVAGRLRPGERPAPAPGSRDHAARQVSGHLDRFARFLIQRSAFVVCTIARELRFETRARVTISQRARRCEAALHERCRRPLEDSYSHHHFGPNFLRRRFDVDAVAVALSLPTRYRIVPLSYSTT